MNWSSLSDRKQQMQFQFGYQNTRGSFCVDNVKSKLHQMDSS